MLEKDRLNGLLKLKECAEDDHQFARYNCELIARLAQEEEEQQEETIRQLARSRCPRCGMRLRQRILHGATIDDCPVCHGLWLDQGELEAASRGGGSQWLTNFLQGLFHFVAHPKG